MKTVWNDLKSLIEIPSYSKEESSVADWMEQRLQQSGLKTQRLQNNVWALAEGFDAALPTVLLNSHLDTVRATQEWTKNPFALTEIGNACYGLGINDAGASLIGLLHVFLTEHAARLSGEKPSYNLLFLASAEEEISGENGMERVVSHLGKVDMAIVGEPTGGAVAVAEKGLLVLDCVATGKAGHAARNTGINALYMALEDIECLRSYSFTKLSPWLGKTTLNVTQLCAGSQHNVIPESAFFTVDIRLTEQYTHTEILAELQAICVSKLTPRSMRLRPSGLQPDHPLERAARGAALVCTGSPTMSDQALMPWPSVKLGIGESERSHIADEYILKHELAEGIERYQLFLKKLGHEIMG